MDETAIYIVDEDGRRREETARLLLGLAERVEIRPSLAEFLTGPEDREIPVLAVVGRTSAEEDLRGLLQRARKVRPLLSLVLLLPPDDDGAGIELLRCHLVDQVAAAGSKAGIFSAVRSELRMIKLTMENSASGERLKRLMKEQARNKRKALELEESYTATLENLMTALDLRDVETFGHSLTVAKYCRSLSRLLGITEVSHLENIRKGALLHDIGKIAIPDAILKKPSRLSAAEWKKVRLHPELGYGLIKEIKLVKEVGHVILCHHERYDGAGYPKGLRKEGIPFEARVFALADALDAITSHRPYRRERDFKAAKKEIQEGRGRQFDPRVVDAFCSVPLEKWARIRYETTKIMPALDTFSEIFKQSTANAE